MRADEETVEARSQLEAVEKVLQVWIVVQVTFVCLYL